MMAHTPWCGVFLQPSGSDMTALLEAMDAAKSAGSSSGAKPKILMIMGDDVCNWNINARRRIGGG
jgi:hypothetical protein